MDEILDPKRRLAIEGARRPRAPDRRRYGVCDDGSESYMREIGLAEDFIDQLRHTLMAYSATSGIDPARGVKP